MPTIDGGWLDQHQRFPPPAPQAAAIGSMLLRSPSNSRAVMY
jgi:hypothetical protein